VKLEFHPEAELELIEAAAHYEGLVPGLGRRFAAEVKRATEVLLEHPEIGARADPDLRRFSLNRFPFTLFYSATSATLTVHVVAHQRRRPGYWRSRTGR
jgi:plasmid stabilization system protein ParE